MDEDERRRDVAADIDPDAISVWDGLLGPPERATLVELAAAPGPIQAAAPGAAPPPAAMAAPAPSQPPAPEPVARPESAPAARASAEMARSPVPPSASPPYPATPGPSAAEFRPPGRHRRPRWVWLLAAASGGALGILLLVLVVLVSNRAVPPGGSPGPGAAPWLVGLGALVVLGLGVVMLARVRQRRTVRAPVPSAIDAADFAPSEPPTVTSRPVGPPRPGESRLSRRTSAGWRNLRRCQGYSASVRRTIPGLADDASEWEVGDLIAGRYDVERKIVSGMGVVYLCHDRAADEPIAIKTYRDLSDLSGGVGRWGWQRREVVLARLFASEALIWMRLGRHPNIVEARYVVELGGKPHLFLERVAGADGRELDVATPDPLRPA